MRVPLLLRRARVLVRSHHHRQRQREHHDRGRGEHGRDLAQERLRPEVVQRREQNVPDVRGTTVRPFDSGAEGGLRAIASAEPGFDVTRFVDGSQAAYRMILEAFWRGDREALAGLTGDEVRSAFEMAIAEREEAGHKLDNRLIAIERAVIEV